MDALIKKILSRFPKRLQTIYEKHNQTWLYLICGALAMTVSIAVQYACAWFLNMPTWTNTTISWICATTFAFFTNKYWVFESKSQKNKKSKNTAVQVLQFFVSRLLVLTLETAFMIITVNMLNANEYIMKLVAQVFVTTANYAASKFMIFKNASNTEEEN